uniref:CCHC-type domain-containing protein n=1 Tax=Biomphalaria glabrata TaxID=6526 RepID=A0A2C9L351_BIOGL
MRIEAGVSVPTEGNSNNSANIESHSSAAWMKKKIQPFAEDKDDIGDYLKRFEIKLAKFNVLEKEWSEILLDFVHGKALTISQNHDHSMQNSYQVLKKELLNAYGHNAATFRKKYYENTPSSQVDPQTTINSEKDFFTKWLGFENVENTYEGLRNFILIDNFINKCDPQLQSFVKERNPKVIEDLVEIIRTFKNAYPNNPLSVSDYKKVIDLVNYVKRNDGNDRDYDRRIDRPKAGDRNLRDVTCFNCQEKGHMAYQCRKHRGNGAGNGNTQDNSGNSDRRGNQGNRRQERDNRPPLTPATFPSKKSLDNLSMATPSQYPVYNGDRRNTLHASNVLTEPSANLTDLV